MAAQGHRPPGRPREFRSDEVVASAAETFWARGYEDVSITDLEEATGVVRTSLYNAYGNKRGLFDVALDHYLTVLFGMIDHQLVTATGGLDDIDGFFDRLEASFASTVPGCLMVNSMIEFGAADRAVAERGRRYLDRLTEGFRATLQRARRRGELAAATPLTATADRLTLQTLGLNTAARFGLDPGQLTDLFVAAHTTVRALRPRQS